ncbi:MAG TPA: ABC transporter permease [Caulobacteraceae bacterium]|jgi:ABC-2 type transport system permease protein|nr:ABC transporter permease [Caulobacteraceae bacterium]
MIKLLRIARREYLAYVRTPGFWLSLLLLPVGLSTIVLVPMVMNRSSPTPIVTVVDFTPFGLTAVVRRTLAEHGPGGRPRAIVVPPPEAFPADAAQLRGRLSPYLQGARTLPGGRGLDAAVIIRPAGESVAIDYWSRNVTEGGLEDTVGNAITAQMRRIRLQHLGVDQATLARVDASNPVVNFYSPKAAAGKVSLADRLPGLAGLAMGMLLWMVVLTGAGMLLNSVMEEKTSRIIEVLLSSASVPEIMGGKILGVACVTGTILAFWMSIAAVLLTLRSPDLAGAMAGVFLDHARWAYFALYFLGGYLMFATLYVTIGAFCETSREAQTLLGPMMIIMSIPPLFMSQAIAHPDAPLMRTLSWVPLFTPFMMAARAANEPPLWEVAATAALMFGVTALELWVAVPAFKSGALATGRFDLRLFFTSLARRQAP